MSRDSQQFENYLLKKGLSGGANAPDFQKRNLKAYSNEQTSEKVSLRPQCVLNRGDVPLGWTHCSFYHHALRSLFVCCFQADRWAQRVDSTSSTPRSSLQPRSKAQPSTRVGASKEPSHSPPEGPPSTNPLDNRKYEFKPMDISPRTRKTLTTARPSPKLAEPRSRSPQTVHLPPPSPQLTFRCCRVQGQSAQGREDRWHHLGRSLGRHHRLARWHRLEYLRQRHYWMQRSRGPRSRAPEYNQRCAPHAPPQTAPHQPQQHHSNHSNHNSTTSTTSTTKAPHDCHRTITTYDSREYA